MSAQIQDLIQSFGALIATGIAPVVNFISGNFVNTLSTAGLLGGLVFSKLGDVAGGALRNIATSAENAGLAVTDALGFRARAATADLAAELESNKNVNLGYSGSIKEIAAGSKKAAQSLLVKAKAGIRILQNLDFKHLLLGDGDSILHKGKEVVSQYFN